MPRSRDCGGWRIEDGDLKIEDRIWLHSPFSILKKLSSILNPPSSFFLYDIDFAGILWQTVNALEMVGERGVFSSTFSSKLR